MRAPCSASRGRVLARVEDCVKVASASVMQEELSPRSKDPRPGKRVRNLPLPWRRILQYTLYNVEL